jgi:hypothetical protein
MDCDVDIISISWSINTTDPDGEDMREFRKAILDAHRKGIVLFCPVMDTGINSRGYDCPACFHESITIGAATGIG